MGWAGVFNPRWESDRTKAILAEELENQKQENTLLESITVETAEAEQKTAAILKAYGLDPGTSAEGGSMASAETMQTMRASGGFQLPAELKSFLPLILGFILVVFILMKK